MTDPDGPTDLAKLDEALPRTHHLEDLLDERLEKGQQHCPAGVAGADPDDRRCLPTGGDHVGEVLILRDDDGVVL